MSGVNKVILVGNVGSDPEIKQVGDNALASFSVATSETWKDKQTGERKEKTEWHRCKVWGRQAEIVERYVRKGSKLYCEGSLRTNSYEKNGETRYSTEVIVSNFQMLDAKSDNDNRGGSGRGWGDNDPWAAQPQQQAGGLPDDDDIPF